MDRFHNLERAKPADKPTFLADIDEPLVSDEPMAACFGEYGGPGLLFVEYKVNAQRFMTAWDTERGKPLRTAWSGFGPTDLSEFLVGNGGPFPGTTMDLFRLRTSRAGQIVFLPKYRRPPVMPVTKPDGAISLAVLLHEFEQASVAANPNSRLKELCRLDDYTENPPKGTARVSWRLTPDGRVLVAVGREPSGRCGPTTHR